MFKTRKWIPMLAAGLVTAVIALAGVLILPQATLAAPATTPVAGRGFIGMAPGSVNDEFLAQALGITVEKLNEAQQKAYEAGIQEALAKGLITQAQADMLKSKPRWGGRGRLGPFFGGDQIDEEKLLADALGISVEKLQEAYQKAADLRLAQAVKDGKITQEQADLMKAREALQKYIQDKGFIKNAIEQAVKDGVITQAQADTFLSQMGRGFGCFGPRGFDMRGGKFGGRGMMSFPKTTPSTQGTGASFRTL